MKEICPQDLFGAAVEEIPLNRTSPFAGKGMGGHQSARGSKDEWLTPPEIVADLGPFDLDPCAPISRPWPTADRHFTIKDNGLMQRWTGRVWCNPPYGNKAKRWISRLAEHGRGTALIFARTETETFHPWVWEYATAIFFMEGRLNFHHVDGTQSEHNAGAPSVLVAYGDGDADRLQAFTAWPGRYVPLRPQRRFILVAVPPAMTWRQLLSNVMERQGRAARLEEIYVLLAQHPKAMKNPNWQAKVRQILQRGPFRRLDRGLWEFAGVEQ